MSGGRGLATRLLSSPRRRRRLRLSALLLALAGVLAFVGLHYSNTAERDAGALQQGAGAARLRAAQGAEAVEHRPRDRPSDRGALHRHGRAPHERRRLVGDHHAEAPPGPDAEGVGHGEHPGDAVPGRSRATDQVHARLVGSGPRLPEGRDPSEGRGERGGSGVRHRARPRRPFRARRVARRLLGSDRARVALARAAQSAAAKSRRRPADGRRAFRRVSS